MNPPLPNLPLTPKLPATRYERTSLTIEPCEHSLRDLCPCGSGKPRSHRIIETGIQHRAHGSRPVRSFLVRCAQCADIAKDADSPQAPIV